MSEYKVSNATFARYIAEIRNFLLEKEPALELTYSRTKKQYFLNDIKRDWFESISFFNVWRACHISKGWKSRVGKSL